MLNSVNITTLTTFEMKRLKLKTSILTIRLLVSPPKYIKATLMGPLTAKFAVIFFLLGLDKPTMPMIDVSMRIEYGTSKKGKADVIAKRMLPTSDGNLQSFLFSNQHDQ